MFNISTKTISSLPRQSSVATFYAIYGIGKVKAYKINTILLHHSHQTMFKKNFWNLLSEEITSNILSRTPLDRALRINTCYHLQNRINTFCYQAHRLFQDLPTKGQRTKCNRRTSKSRNPYLILKIDLKFYPELSKVFKRQELISNSRFEELKALDDDVKEVKTKKSKKGKKKS